MTTATEMAANTHMMQRNHDLHTHSERGAMIDQVYRCIADAIKALKFKVSHGSNRFTCSLNFGVKTRQRLIVGVAVEKGVVRIELSLMTYVPNDLLCKSHVIHVDMAQAVVQLNSCLSYLKTRNANTLVTPEALRSALAY